MKCPSYNEKMEAGYLQNRKRVAWTKKIHKFSLNPREGEVMIQNNLFNGINFQAHICKQCKKVVLDYSDKDYKEG